MTRWRSDPQAASDQLILRSLDNLDLAGRVLAVNQVGAVPALLQRRGVAVAVWNRRRHGDLEATSWPPAGPFALAIVRLAKAKDEQAMTAHAVLSRLAPSGRLILYGGNDEGIRSAASMLEELCGQVEQLATRGHGRVVAAPRPADPGLLKSALAEWRLQASLEIAGVTRRWVTYPGIFAAGRIDEGTRLLVAALPVLVPGARVLDFGCGSGVIGAAAIAAEPTIVLDMLDDDAVALEAARENVPEAKAILGTSLRDGGAAYDVILSNPPLHQGIAEDREHLARLVRDAPARLNAGGMLQIVAQRRVPLHENLAKHFASVRVAAENTRYRIWMATR